VYDSPRSFQPIISSYPRSLHLPPIPSHPLFFLFIANENYFSVSGKEVEKDVQVGMIVLILAEEILDRSFRRFQWWEKPPPDVITFMANKEGEKLSLSLLTPALTGDVFSALDKILVMLLFAGYLQMI
jgi:hypothetical protein